MPWLHSQLSTLWCRAWLSVLLVTGCTQEPSGAAPVSDEAPEGTPSAAGDPSPAAGAAVADAEVEEPYLVLATTSLRRAPTEDKKVSGEGGRAESNWLMNLHRGEEVLQLGTQGDWARVRTSGELVGWIKSDRLARGAEAKPATLLEEAKVWVRPDVTALDPKRVLEPGDLLYVIKQKEEFSLVDYPRSEYQSAQAWVMTDRLSQKPDDVGAAKMVTRIRALRSKDDEAARSLEETARSMFKNNPVLALLDASAGESQAPEQPTQDAPAPAAVAAGDEG